jgi:predicted TPR repeat methyltransferase
MASARLPIDGDPLEHAESLIAEGRAADAASFLRERLAQGRGGLLARLVLVRALRAAGDLPAALIEAREAVSLNPNIAQALVALGELLLAAGQLPTAIAELQRALRIDPGLVQARYLVGCAWLEAGEADRALDAFASLGVNDVPDRSEKIAQAEAMKAEQRSNAGYVRHLFDQFSADYDQRMLGQLNYQAPQILRSLADLVMPRAEGLAILDLGCGTGLTGSAFEDMALQLDGVDLSPKMIERARALDIYDRVWVSDLEASLAEAGPPYDLLLAADTLVYLGDLETTFAGAASRLKEGGHFLFTVERHDGEGFALGLKRRWRHAEPYLRSLAASHGLAVAGFLEAVPRTEAGVPVPGYAVALRKD